MASWKLAIIALDGVSHCLIARWAREGHLPHLARLMDRGAFGELESVLPPVTGAAWGSFLTGLSPGRHGVYEWLRRREGSYRLELIDGSALPGPTLFEWLSAHGLRVGAVSVPLTSPIRPVNGFIVGDLLTPPGRPYTYPGALQAEIERELGERYPVAPPPWPGGPRAQGWLRALKSSLDARARAAQYLAARRDWDLFMVHVMETDSVQHQMWHALDGAERPRYRVRVAGNPVLEIYKRADALVGELLEIFDEETIVWVISDHGFGSHLYNVHINTWLLRHGFLKLRRNAPTRAKRALFELGITPENLYPCEERLRLLGRARGEQAYRWLSRFALSMQNIDWRRTAAYSYGNVGQIYLNRAGREPTGIVSPRAARSVLRDLEAALLDWKNPWTGGSVVAQIYRREEIYGERALERTPELIFRPAEGHSPMGLSEFLSNRVVSHPVAHSGWHRLEGVFVGAGGPLPSGELAGLKLIDLFPTICALLGAPVPEGLDGRIIEGLTGSGNAESGVLTAQHAPRGESSASTRRDGGDGGRLTQAEEEEIRERLRGLGYL